MKITWGGEKLVYNLPVLSKQLKRTLQLTDARWAVWLWRDLDGWRFDVRAGMPRARQRALSALLARPAWHNWLSGALANGRSRRRKVDNRAAELGCRRVYAFPAEQGGGCLLVGADELDVQARHFWQVLAWEPPSPTAGRRPEPAEEEAPRPFVLQTAASYDLSAVLEQVLVFLAARLACAGALIALRSGKRFEVRSVWHLPEAWLGQEVDLESALPLRRMVSRRKTARWEGPLAWRGGGAGRNPAWAFEEDTRWLGVPLVLGRRVIGVALFAARRGEDFDEESVRHLPRQAAQAAHLVENAIVFDEAGRYLQQLALVSELAAASVGEVRQGRVINRVLRRLERAFDHVQAALLTRSEDDHRLLRVFGNRESLWGEPVAADSIPGGEAFLDSGSPLQGEALPEGLEFPWFGGVSYAYLLMPLRYRGHFIGAIHLGRTRPQPFSRQEEQALVMLAGHLAGLLENVRLHAETQQRAENLALIHTVVQRVVGLTSVDEIAQASAELMAANFAFDRVLVAGVPLSGERFTILGLAGLDADPGLRGARFPSACGLFGRVLLEGRSVRIAHLSGEMACEPLSPLPQSAVMAVPLYDGERVFGALYVERVAKAFTSNDLMALQALAGVLSSVMVNAQRYQQLRTSVRQLQAVRETALDMAGEMDLEVLLGRVVHRVRLLLEAKGAELALLDAGSGKVRIVVSENPWQDYTGREIPMMGGIIGRVVALGEPMVVSDYNTWEGRQNPDEEEPFCAVAAVPLRLKGQVMGVLSVSDDTEGRIFRSDDVRLLELLAPQVAVFIRNARLYRELQERMAAQKETEQQLIRSARLAAVGEMAAGVAHELNNPLTTVAGFVELVLDELPEDWSQRADLELVLREARRARSVVRNLLDFSRPGENIRLRTDMNALIGEVLTLVQHLIRTTGVELRLQLWDELPWVRVDPNQIKQVLLNLVHNALQAMPHGGVLTVQTTHKRRNRQRWLIVRVEDTGVGIHEENLSRIFEPFFTTRPVGSGTGLGLSVSYGIIKEHGGHIEVDSTPGKGSVFTVWLPVGKKHD